MKINNMLLMFVLPILLIHHVSKAHTNIRTLPFKKVIIWGHKLHSHTHSYIHYAFYKTFKHLGYDTYWLDNTDEVSTIDFTNSLFITAGQVDQKIPLRNDCRYILHNCNLEKYQPLFEQNLCILLQVYTHDCIKRNDTKIDDCIYMDINNKILYMPWATDLLPYEIDAIKKQVSHRKTEDCFYWIGSVWGDNEQGNYDTLNQFVKACTKNNIKFKQFLFISPEENIQYMQQSYLAPALQGQWQCENGYIPCRIFKNISYGQMGITNSKTVYDLFKGKIVYNQDAFQLFYDAQERLRTMDITELYELMDFVRDNHTYINRVQSLLDFMNIIKPFNN
ncbi:MAG: hypothetical protein NTX86_01180 [Candidatus Dependentiae bacterium]|nr:hypothetical protein [Candidatus Dependentiae bacterium]